MKTKIIICDDHQVILDSLALLISTMDNTEVLATFSKGSDALLFLENHQPDVLISDLTMPGMNGIELTMKARALQKNLEVLMLTVEEDHQAIREAFNAGISGYVLKRAGKAELEKAITTVKAGQKYFSNDVLKELLNPSQQLNGNDEMPTSLTDREKEIIQMLAKEFSTNEIARLLYVSPGTVKTHRHNIMRKLGVKNSIGIIKFAIHNGLV